MRRIIAISFLFFAWLCANGAIWDVAQVVAWTRMFAGYSESLPMGDALRETLDARKPCNLCRAIAKAKNSEQKQAPQQIEHGGDKLTLACDSPVKIILTKPPVDWPELQPTIVICRVEPVPLPPPRA